MALLRRASSSLLRRVNPAWLQQRRWVQSASTDVTVGPVPEISADAAPAWPWKEPAVIRGVAAAAIARQSRAGDLALARWESEDGVEVERGSYLSERGHVTVPLAWFVAYLRLRHRGGGDAQEIDAAVGGPLYAAQRDDLLRAPTGLRSLAAALTPAVCAAMSGLSAPIATPLPARAGDLSVSAWLGPAGTLTPLHSDPLPNAFVQVVSASVELGACCA